MYAQKIPFTLVEYNCENLFDCRHDSLKDDYEYMPDAEKHWTFGRYWKKLNNIGRVIHQCGGVGEKWQLPDLVALVEVENDSTLFMLSRRSMLKGAGYRFLITNSDDARGVDVALMYNPFTFRPMEHHSLRVMPAKGDRKTRDVLYVKGTVVTGADVHVFVVHAPSRSGGQTATDGYRLAVARKVMESVDSIRSVDADANIIVAGDFNDYTNDKSMRFYRDKGLTDVSENAVGMNCTRRNKKGKEVLNTGCTGTYKYQGQWNSLDHILLSEPMKTMVSECFVYDAQWLLEKDSQGGYKPFRNYLGPIYHGGISDHLPLVLRLLLPAE